MRKVNYTWQNLKMWLALVLLGVGTLGYSQATFTGNPITIPASGAASGTVGVACVGQIANGANITLNVNLAHTFMGEDRKSVV